MTDLPIHMIDKATGAHAEHLVTVISYDLPPPHYGWRCSCDAGRRPDDGLTTWEISADQAHEHAASAILAAALDGCEVREQSQYIWSNGGRSKWFDTEPRRLGEEYVLPDGSSVTSVSVSHRLVITTPAEDTAHG